MYVKRFNIVNLITRIQRKTMVSASAPTPAMNIALFENTGDIAPASTAAMAVWPVDRRRCAAPRQTIFAQRTNPQLWR